MAVKVRIPTPLQTLTNNQPEVSIEGATVGELIEKLNTKYPGLKERVCDESGKVRRFINIFVNEQDIRFLEKEDTAVKEGDEISIVPAIAGG